MNPESLVYTVVTWAAGLSISIMIIVGLIQLTRSVIEDMKEDKNKNW